MSKRNTLTYVNEGSTNTVVISFMEVSLVSRRTRFIHVCKVTQARDPYQGSLCEHKLANLRPVVSNRRAIASHLRRFGAHVTSLEWNLFSYSMLMIHSQRSPYVMTLGFRKHPTVYSLTVLTTLLSCMSDVLASGSRACLVYQLEAATRRTTTVTPATL